MSGPPETCQRTVLYAGRVQGVGFRYTTERIAREFAVTGSVRNLADGRVEVVAEGAPEEIGRFLQALEDRMGGHIRERQATEGPAGGGYSDFSIQF